MRTADYLEVDWTPDCDPTASGVQLFIEGKRDGWAAFALEELNLISTYPRVHKQMLNVTGIDFNYVCLKTWDFQLNLSEGRRIDLLLSSPRFCFWRR